MKINDNFLKLEASYLFSTVAKKQREYQAAHPDKDVIRLSIGDVTKPLAPAVIDAMHKAVDEMANEATFRGYPPEYGYDFILNAIQKNDYTDRGIDIATDEIPSTTSQPEKMQRMITSNISLMPGINIARIEITAAAMPTTRPSVPIIASLCSAFAFLRFAK